jgi:hypothetical protein
VMGRRGGQITVLPKGDKMDALFVPYGVDSVVLVFGAGHRNRTYTALRPPDFESGASASSASPANFQNTTNSGFLLYTVCTVRPRFVSLLVIGCQS